MRPLEKQIGVSQTRAAGHFASDALLQIVIAKPLHTLGSSPRAAFARHALDQLERGGQDGHCSQPDCGEAGDRRGSTGRTHCGCFEILKPAHRNACGLFQPVDVGNRQSHSSRAQQLR
ncbi:hypothetical protein BQ8794_110250 [Mesorhizobium prunaredense]|uniref:Uncharacterized protein n=1 Tax=Mesorhizobium prunaredense TaxID=1631249 RepID=A0A1R3V3X6_9HYPH|nr:hypothetical protein BQ8794_110250 [Mesorhizobium prunaredense]